MSSRIIVNKKWKDLYNIKETEVIISIILTNIIIIVALLFDLRGNFVVLQDSIKSVIAVFLGGLLAMLGFVLTGIAIVISLFDKKMLKILKKMKKEEAVLQILTSYEFSGISLVITVLLLTILFVFISANVPVVGAGVFYGGCYITIYLVLFNLFYIIALIGNCIRLYLITIKFDELEILERSLIDDANEIRIDYILNSIGNAKSISREALRNMLIEYTNRTDKPSKKDIVEYFQNYYQ